MASLFALRDAFVASSATLRHSSVNSAHSFALFCTKIDPILLMVNAAPATTASIQATATGGFFLRRFPISLRNLQTAPNTPPTVATAAPAAIASLANCFSTISLLFRNFFLARPTNRTCLLILKGADLIELSRSRHSETVASALALASVSVLRLSSSASRAPSRLFSASLARSDCSFLIPNTPFALSLDTCQSIRTIIGHFPIPPPA